MELGKGAGSWIVEEDKGAGGDVHKPFSVPAGSTPCMTFPTSLKQFGSSPACPGFLGIREVVSGSGWLPLSQAAVSPLCHW